MVPKGDQRWSGSTDRDVSQQTSISAFASGSGAIANVQTVNFVLLLRHTEIAHGSPVPAEERSCSGVTGMTESGPIAAVIGFELLQCKLAASPHFFGLNFLLCSCNYSTPVVVVLNPGEGDATARFH
jgi:hypothetical protein